MKTAVILFAYQRPRYLKKCLASFKKAYEPKLAFHYYAFVDYSWLQDKIARMIRESGIFDMVYKRKRKMGLNDNITQGIYEKFQTYDAIIVIEDDIVLEPSALSYLIEMLEKHKNDKSIGQVNLSGNFQSSHGWATWKDRWQKVCFNNFPLEGDLAKEYLKHKSWDTVYSHNFNLQGWEAIGEKLATHIGNIGTHYNILSRFSIRKQFRKWKNDYYRDKNLLMEKESLIHNFYRLFI